MALQVDDKVQVKADALPRVQYPNGDVKPALNPVEAVVRVVNDPDEIPGKLIGLELNAPGENLVWFDAHGCDGKCPRGFGWWVTNDNLVRES